MNILLRELEKGDIEYVLPLLQKMFLEHDQIEPGFFTSASYSRDQIEKYLNEALESKTCKVFVATKDTEIVGTIRATIKEAPSFYKDKWIGYTDDLVVKEVYRRKGIGGELINKSIEYYKLKGITLIESKIYEFNKPSQALSEKNGFKKTFSYYYKRI